MRKRHIKFENFWQFFYVKLFQKEKCNKTIQKKFSNKIDFQKKEQMKKVMKMFEFSF